MAAFGAPHRRRLREIWRGAGWPCHDPIELDLLTAGCLERFFDPQGRETLRVTAVGLARLSDARAGSTAALEPHEALVRRVALNLQRDGRIVWRGLALRAPLLDTAGATRWATAMPDVFSIRHGASEDALVPLVHEVKVRRADLLADLRQPSKRQAYQALAAACWYVLAEGIGEPADVPPPFGVLLAGPERFTVARPAELRPTRVDLQTWISLARANAEPAVEEAFQQPLRTEDGEAAA